MFPWGQETYLGLLEFRHGHRSPMGVRELFEVLEGGRKKWEMVCGPGWL